MALPIAATESTIATKNLTRLLSRLDSKLASQKATPLSPVDRAKFAANLEYARQLLLSLESESVLIRNTSTRQSVLSGLGVQKQAIRRLNEQLLVMAAEGEEEEGGDSTDDDSNEREEEGEEVKELAAFPAEVNGGNPPQQSENIPTLTTTTTSTLRNRFQPTATPTNRHQRKQLFPPPDSTAVATDADTEKHLSSQRAEQEHITADMLSLAQALKQSSLRFGSELENEKALLDMAQEGLDKNTLGIEGTGRKLEALRKDENVGFLWSILYPVIIVGLAFVVLFVLFFAPKLRW